MRPPENSGPVEPVAAAPARPAPTDRELRLRIRQQEILSEIGVLALQGASFEGLLNDTARLTAEGLEAEFCKILQHQPENHRLLVIAGVGWGPDVIGRETVGVGVESPAGYALHTGKPVISNQLDQEKRFRAPDLLLRYGIRRAIYVILQGDGAPFGVLAVDTRRPGAFVEHDLSFMQGAANILGLAIERRLYEERLKAALSHQQVLLKEVNHRVKNSLQLVASMLRLQASSSGNEAVNRSLTEAQTRVMAIGRAHERLYKSTDVSRLDLGAYLGDVCEDLAAGTTCKLVFEGREGISVATDRAIPLALLVNELVTNSAKYAYPHEEGGEITVRLAPAGDEKLVLTVTDLGVGMPPGLCPAVAGSLGMRLINAFVAKLGATIEYHRLNPGTRVQLLVPREHEAENG